MSWKARPSFWFTLGGVLLSSLMFALPAFSDFQGSSGFYCTPSGCFGPPMNTNVVNTGILNANSINDAGALNVGGISTLGVTGTTSLTCTGFMDTRDATINGNLTVGASFLDLGNANVQALFSTGITDSGNAAIAGTLAVAGGETVTGALNANALTCTSLADSGNATISQNLLVVQNENVVGNLTVTGSVIMGSAAFTSISTSSLTDLGPLGVSGTATMQTVNANTLTCTAFSDSGVATFTGATTFANSVIVAGTSTLGVVNGGAATFTSMVDSGNANITGVLNVTGPSNLASSTFTSSTTTGNATFNQNVVLATSTSSIGWTAGTQIFMPGNGQLALETATGVQTNPFTLWFNGGVSAGNVGQIQWAPNGGSPYFAFLNNGGYSPILASRYYANSVGTTSVYAYEGPGNAGILFPSAGNAISFGTNAIVALAIDTSQNSVFSGTVTQTKSLVSANGTAAAPAYTNSTATAGLFYPTNTTVGLSSNGVAAVTFSSTQVATFSSTVNAGSFLLNNADGSVRIGSASGNGLAAGSSTTNLISSGTIGLFTNGGSNVALAIDTSQNANFSARVLTPAQNVSYNIQSATYTVVATDYVVAESAAGGAVVVNLQTAVAAGKGRLIAVIKTDNSVNTVTITPNGADKINNTTTFVLTAGATSVWIVSDGASNWYAL